MRVHGRTGWRAAGMVALAMTLLGCGSVDAASTRLSGTYSWQSTVGPLEGTFTPTDTPGEFKAKFRFRFSGKWKTSAENGALEATHFEIEGDGEVRTGTIELRPETP